MTTTDRRIEVVVAYDFGPRPGEPAPDLNRLLELMSDAVISVATGTKPCGSDNEERTVHRIRFDTNNLRNTEANGMAYRCGFISHIETDDAPPPPRPAEPSASQPDGQSPRRGSVRGEPT